jgi:pimeloyl-ACP methyl ester carboxylesterase
VAAFLRNDPGRTRRAVVCSALHSNIKGSTLTVLKNARHLTPLEKPDEIAAELEKLLK